MTLPAFTADMPAVVDFGVPGQSRELVLGSLKSCAETARPRIGEPMTFQVIVDPNVGLRELSRAEISKVVGAYG